MILIKQNLSWKLLVAIGKVRENIFENNLREKGLYMNLLLEKLTWKSKFHIKGGN